MSGIDTPCDAEIKRNAVAVEFRKDSPKVYEKCGLARSEFFMSFVATKEEQWFRRNAADLGSVSCAAEGS